MAREKILHCKAMGAEVVLTRSDVGRGYPDYYQDLAEAITARTPGALFIDQFANPANPQAHESTRLAWKFFVRCRVAWMRLLSGSARAAR
jgi:cystathionine beta-synthase